jgi:hypothetical protein
MSSPLVVQIPVSPILRRMVRYEYPHIREPPSEGDDVTHCNMGYSIG